MNNEKEPTPETVKKLRQLRGQHAFRQLLQHVVSTVKVADDGPVILSIPDEEMSDVTSVGDKYSRFVPGFRPQPETVTETVQPETLTAAVGSLVIVSATDGPKCGTGTKVYLDGREVEKLRSITLRIAVDEAVTATMERLV